MADRTEYMRKWREDNRDKVIAQKRAWNQANKDYINSTRKIYRKKNRERLSLQRSAWEKTSEKFKKWQEVNADKLRDQNRISAMRRYYRYRDEFIRLNETCGANRPRRVALFYKWEKCGEICYICGLRVSIENIHADHVIPISRGGSSEIWNLMPTHNVCNRSKGNRMDFPIACPELVNLVSNITCHARNSRRRMDCDKRKPGALFVSEAA